MKSESTQVEAVRAVVAPVVGALGLDLYDIEIIGGGGASGGGNLRTLRVTVTKPAGAAEEGGLDIEAIADATRALSPALDDLAGPGLNSAYLLEVSSPGVERALRRPEHYLGAINESVVVKFHTDAGPERVHGTMVSADAAGFVVNADGDERAIAYDAVTSAHTIFEWGPQPRPGGPAKNGPTKKGAAKKDSAKNKSAQHATRAKSGAGAQGGAGARAEERS